MVKDGMEDDWASFGIGFVAGMRCMTATAALVWATHLGRSRTDWILSGSLPCRLATAAALAEMAGAKMPSAPDRHIPASLLTRLAIGAVGQMVFSRWNTSLSGAARSGMVGVVAGTVFGRVAPGTTTRSRSDCVRALSEDVAAAGLATNLVRRFRGTDQMCTVPELTQIL
jgi:uncharacterized membrane protein